MKKVLCLLSVIFFFGSCSEYQQVFKGDDIALKSKLAETLYKEGKYKKALKLYEQIAPKYRGKPQAERIMYFYADTYYQLEDYVLAGYQFERYLKSFPDSDKAEEVAFKGAKSYYYLSPSYSLDQEDTDIGLKKLQSYINSFPEGSHLEEANALVVELRTKKEKKAYRIAKQYHHRAQYKVAIASFDTYLVDYPGSFYREKALYYKLESQYLLAIGSYDRLVKDRLETALVYYKNYRKYYKEGEYADETEEIAEDIKSKLDKIK